VKGVGFSVEGVGCRGERLGVDQGRISSGVGPSIHNEYDLMLFGIDFGLS